MVFWSLRATVASPCKVTARGWQSCCSMPALLLSNYIIKTNELPVNLIHARIVDGESFGKRTDLLRPNIHAHCESFAFLLVHGHGHIIGNATVFESANQCCLKASITFDGRRSNQVKLAISSHKGALICCVCRWMCALFSLIINFVLN